MAVAAAGVAVLSVAIIAGGAKLASPDAAMEAVAVEDFEMDDAFFDADGDDIPDAGQGQSRARSGRPEAVDSVTPLATEGASLQRIEPRLPLSDLALAAPPREGEPKPTLLHKPLATAAGRIEAQGHLIELPGLQIVEPEDKCQAADGASWPCGMMARTAFRNWLRARAVECTVSDTPSPGPVATACRLGKTDIGSWLVSNGWARATVSRYEEDQEAAQTARAGIWGDGAAHSR